MYFEEQIKKIINKQKITIFVDMDGVITYYDVGKPNNFKNKRPLFSNLKILEKLSKLDNITLCILSICRQDFQIEEKNVWLDRYAPFFRKENRFVISKESNPGKSSKTLKVDFLKDFKTDAQIVVIDDDNGILKEMNKYLKEVILFQDSVLVD